MHCLSSPKDDCQNYIRVLAPTRDGRLLVCGTNAYNPKCRYYITSGDDAAVEREFSGKGLCPYDPRHNSTAIYSGESKFSACLVTVNQNVVVTETDPP